ncbi:thioesterase family protein [Penicillium herquei]|nr:thioesterase family protein [Penicillium herquei]
MSVKPELLLLTDDFPDRVQSAFKVLTTKADKIWSLPLEDCKLQVETTSTHITPSITFRLRVTPGMLNGAGALHGGCASTLIDDLTTVLVAAVSRPGLYSLYGVGIEVRIVCHIEQLGRRLAVLRAKVYRVEDGMLCMSGENEKMNTDPLATSKI